GWVGEVVALELRPRSRVHEDALEDGLDVVRATEDAVEPRMPAIRIDDGEIAGPRVPESLAVDDERDAGREERLADDELAALRELDNDLDAAFSHGRPAGHGARHRYATVTASLGSRSGRALRLPRSYCSKQICPLGTGGARHRTRV